MTQVRSLPAHWEVAQDARQYPWPWQTRRLHVRLNHVVGEPQLLHLLCFAHAQTKSTPTLSSTCTFPCTHVCCSLPYCCLGMHVAAVATVDQLLCFASLEAEQCCEAERKGEECVECQLSVLVLTPSPFSSPPHPSISWPSSRRPGLPLPASSGGF